MKLLNTSLSLLTYTGIYNDRGSLVGYFLFYDATMKFMGPQHIPFAILAILVLLVGILFPLLFLLLYPMQWFQKCLNKYHLNSPGLQMFMERFQGHYRDRTDGGWECRYFAAVYPTLKIATYVVYSVTRSNIEYVGFILLCLGVVAAVLLVQPYKKRYALYNKLDAVIIVVLVFIVCNLETVLVTDTRQITGNVGMIAAGVVAIAPLVYFIVKALQLLKHVLSQNNVCPCHILCDCNGIQRGDYEDLSATETPINTLY